MNKHLIKHIIVSIDIKQMSHFFFRQVVQFIEDIQMFGINMTFISTKAKIYIFNN